MTAVRYQLADLVSEASVLGLVILSNSELGTPQAISLGRRSSTIPHLVQAWTR